MLFETKGSILVKKTTLVCSVFPILADMEMLASLSAGSQKFGILRTLILNGLAFFIV